MTLPRLRPADGTRLIFGGVVAFALLAGVTDLVVLALGGLPAEQDAVWVERGMLAQAAAMLAVLGFRAWYGLDVPWRGHGRLGRVALAYAGFMLLWAPFAFAAWPALLNALGAPLEPQPHLQYFVSAAPDRATFWVVAFAVCVLGPVTEEIVFRGYLQTGLTRAFGRALALTTVSLAFGAMHGLRLSVPLAAMGLFFGILRERTGGMLAPVAAHVLHNSLMVAIVALLPRVFGEVFQR
jgi:membrane protease YdiL (CAAX protease family)